MNSEQLIEMAQDAVDDNRDVGICWVAGYDGEIVNFIEIDGEEFMNTDLLNDLDFEDERRAWWER